MKKLLVALLAVAPSAFAQHRVHSGATLTLATETPWMRRETQAASVEKPLAILVAGGIAGGAAMVGIAHIVGDCDLFRCGTRGTIALALSPIAIPLGVHLANSRRGHVAPAILWSYTATFLLLAAGLSTIDVGSPTPTLLFVAAIPVTQLVASVALERHTERVRRRASMVDGGEQ